MICFRSRPSAPPQCCTAVLIYRANQSLEYALPPYAHLTIEKKQELPWTASFCQWHRLEDKKGFYFVDRSYTFYHDARN